MSNQHDQMRFSSFIKINVGGLNSLHHKRPNAGKKKLSNCMFIFIKTNIGYCPFVATNFARVSHFLVMRRSEQIDHTVTHSFVSLVKTTCFKNVQTLKKRFPIP